MDLYGKNIKFLKENLQYVHTAIMNGESRFQSIVSSEGSSNLRVDLEHKSCMLHSCYSIERETAEAFSSVDETVECIAVFGMGLWHYMEHIRKTYRNLRHLIIIEPDLNIFKEVIHKIDLTGLGEQNTDLTLILDRSEDEVIAIISKILSTKSLLKMELVYSISYRSLYTDYFDAIYRGMATQFRKYHISYATNNSLLYPWVRNIMLNYKKNAIPVTKLINQFKGIPIIIVSAGPSLNYNMHYLKEVKDKAVIMAVGSAIKILDSNGIVPHFRVAFDFAETEGKIFDDIETTDSILVFADTLYHSILERYEGTKIRMALDTGSLDRYIFENLYNEQFSIKSGFSVANVALDLALKIGSNKIIFMGQDLSYTEGSLYAKGSWKQEETIDFEKDGFIKITNTLGETVYTDKTFLSMRDLFVSIIKTNPGVVYLNATERGLNIEGAANKSFEKILEEDLRESKDVEELVHSLMLANEIDENDWTKRLEKLNFGEIIEDLSAVNDHRIKKLIRLKKQSERGTAANKLNRDLNEIETYVNKQLKDLAFYQVVVAPALRVKFHALLTKFKYSGSDEKELFESNFEIALGKATEIKIYLDFLSNAISAQLDSESL